METNRQVQCKCHGTSGSCDVRTCWRAISNFRSVGTVLKHLYESAMRLRYIVSREKSPRDFRSIVRRRTVRSGGLLYYRSSRDPCLPDNARGLSDVRGRVCGDRTSGDAACARICCGRGHVIRRRTLINTRCRCRFRYCCYVTCESCQQTIEEYICR